MHVRDCVYMFNDINNLNFMFYLIPTLLNRYGGRASMKDKREIKKIFHISDIFKAILMKRTLTVL